MTDEKMQESIESPEEVVAEMSSLVDQLGKLYMRPSHYPLRGNEREMATKLTAKLGICIKQAEGKLEGIKGNGAMRQNLEQILFRFLKLQSTYTKMCKEVISERLFIAGEIVTDEAVEAIMLGVRGDIFSPDDSIVFSIANQELLDAEAENKKIIRLQESMAEAMLLGKMMAMYFLLEEETIKEIVASDAREQNDAEKGLHDTEAAAEKGLHDMEAAAEKKKKKRSTLVTTLVIILVILFIIILVKVLF